MKAASTVEAYATMKAAAVETAAGPPPRRPPPAEAARSAHHSGSGVEAAACRSWSAVNAVGVITASYVVIARSPVMNVGAEVVIVGYLYAVSDIRTLHIRIRRTELDTPTRVNRIPSRMGCRKFRLLE